MKAGGAAAVAITVLSSVAVVASLAHYASRATVAQERVRVRTLATIVPRMTGFAPFVYRFGSPGGARGPITNAYAYFQSDDPRSVPSASWEMTSGSVFSRRGVGWTGTPDLARPDARSANGTGSVVFRLRTRRHDFVDVDVRLRVRVLRWTAHRRQQRPLVVLWVRYQSEQRLYSPTILSADGRVDIEKKTPGGPHAVNGGTYYILPPYSDAPDWPVRLGQWYDVGVRVCNRSDGGVSITTMRDGQVMQRAVDPGAGHPLPYARSGTETVRHGAALRAPGRVGIRSDDAELEFGRYDVRPAGRQCDEGRPRS